ncbi:hypothetical protein ccbrp13_20770 [Ktedonobacteria bacterium brp13]|nr:hypothetical protein ccbrp13_20770 [Ktedonobacteria bacterium brp13]
MNIQQQFEAFHETIKLGRFEENQILREKRDIIKDKLELELPKIFERYGEKCPAFSFRDQGSYEMGTGTKPLYGDYDIDQGLYFMASTADYPNPVILKKRVHKALDGHTQQVRIRQSCVTVFYQQAGEPIYHVDIAVYSDGEMNADSVDRLAKGKEYSTEEYRFWEVSNPQGLRDTLLAGFEREIDRDQFRRIVRYLKRWKDENFLKDGNAAPRGIGLTILAYDHLQPSYTNDLDCDANDLEALRILVRATLNRFSYIWDDVEQKSVRRLVVPLPVEPRNDLFGRLTNCHMEDFEQKLKEVQEALDAAAIEVDPAEACKHLQRVFGADFPVPLKEGTAKRHAPAIISSSSSA